MEAKKKQTGLLIGIILLVLVLVLTLIGGLLYYFVWRTPQRRLIKGLTYMVKEVQDYGNPVIEEIGFAEVLDNRKDAGTFDLSMNLGLPWFKKLPTIGVDFVRDYDYEAEKMQVSLGLSAYNIELLQGRTTVIGDTLYLEIPEVLSDAYSVNLDSLGEDYNDSVWTDLTGVRIKDDFSYDFFARSGTGRAESLGKLKKELAAVFAADLAEIRDHMMIEEIGERKEIQRNGKTVTCDGILITLDKDDLERMADDLSDVVFNSDYVEELLDRVLPSEEYYDEAVELKERLQEFLEEQFKLELKDDLQICFYLDNKDRILAIETYNGIDFKNSGIENLRFFLEFTGSNRTLDSVAGEILFEQDGNEFTVEIEREIELTKEVYEKTYAAAISVEGAKEQIEIEYVSSWDIAENEFDLEFISSASSDTLSMSAKGAFSEIEKGEAFTLDLGSFNLSMDGQTLFTLSGSLRMEPFEGNITAPNGSRDFFHLNQFEILGLILELNEIVEELDF